MRKVEFLDASLRDGETDSGLISLSKEKIAIASNWKMGIIFCY